MRFEVSEALTSALGVNPVNSLREQTWKSSCVLLCQVKFVEPKHIVSTDDVIWLANNGAFEAIFAFQSRNLFMPHKSCTLEMMHTQI